MNIAKDLTQLVGKTPIVRINRLNSGNGTILAKLEYFNPANSVKDRAALQMIVDAENEGKITPTTTIIEPTSGNTGIGLAMICAVRGYKIILTMPESMSIERRMLLKAYGAELVLTPASEGMKGAVNKAMELHEQNPDSFIPSQFDNPANPTAHFDTTGPEIWKDTNGNVDAFVAGVGTGGTLSGVSAYLKSQNPSCHVVAVEPASSPLLSKGHAGAHGLQGIGANFIPENLRSGSYDEVFPVTEEEAYAAARAFAKNEGLLVGITSGAALHAAAELASRPTFAGKTVVALLPDTGDRYLSTPLFGEN